MLIFPDKVYKLYDDEAVKELEIVYLDLTRAFDTVQHKALIHKVQEFGVGGKLLRLPAS